MINIVNKVLFSLSIVIFFYILFKSSIFVGKIKTNYDYYLFISLVISLILFANFYLTKIFTIYITIILLSIFSSLYIFEAYLIYLQLPKKINQIKIDRYFEQTGKKYDERNMMEIYKDLKIENKNIVVKIPPYLYLESYKDIFPVSGISNRPTILCNENGYYSIYDSDRYGFNNPDFEWDEDEVEFLMLGDSFTHGACANRPNEMASILRKLSQKTVLNLGYSSNGPLLQYVGLREYIKKNVKNIVWLYFEGNDNQDLINELKNKILLNYLQNLNFSQNLKNNQILIDKRSNELIDREINQNSLRFSFNIISFIKLSEIRNFYFSKKEEIPYNRFNEILNLSKKLAINNNSKFHFVYLPQYERFKKNFNNQNYNKIKSIVLDLNINFIDPQKMMNNLKNPFIFYPFELAGHYNNYGQRKIAEYIYQKIKND